MGPLLTIDIWDTLLRRACHPDEIKLVTAKRIFMRFGSALRQPYTVKQLFDLRVQTEREIGKQRQTTGLDDEYEIVEALTLVLERALTAVALESHDREEITAFAARLADAEMTHEMAVCSLDRAGADIVLAASRTHGDRVAAVSDFYMGQTRMRAILDKVAPEISARLGRIFVSCDVHLNKRSGRLFDHVRSEMQADAADHVHVGDNPWSDVKMAEQSGATARLFTHEPLDAARRAHEKRFSMRMDGDIVPTLDPIRRTAHHPGEVPDDLTPSQQRLFALGRRYSPIFAGLVLSACERAAAVGAPAIHYFTREGEFFSRVHQKLDEAAATGLPMPKPIVLEVSRIATFFPTLNEITTREMMRLWNQYSTQSLGQMVRSLGVCAFAAQPFIERHALTLDEVVMHPWKDERVVSLFGDRVFCRFLEHQRDERRELLFGYLAARGLAQNTKNAVVVDIGWRGTIQDNLAHLLPGTQISGVYLGLQRLLNIQPDNVHKQAFGPDARKDQPALVELLRCVAPYEMVTNAPTGSVRGYTRVDGEIVADRVNDAGEDHVHQQFIGAFQQGALSAMHEIARSLRVFALTSDDVRPMCAQLLREFAHEPDPELARAFFSLVHNETFGVGGFVDKRFKLPRDLVARAHTSDEGWNEFVAFLDTTSWPCGFLRLHGLDDLHARYMHRVQRNIGVRSQWTIRTIKRARATRLGQMVPDRLVPKSLIKRALGIQEPAPPAAIDVKQITPAHASNPMASAGIVSDSE